MKAECFRKPLAVFLAFALVAGTSSVPAYALEGKATESPPIESPGGSSGAGVDAGDAGDAGAGADAGAGVDAGAGAGADVGAGDAGTGDAVMLLGGPGDDERTVTTDIGEIQVEENEVSDTGLNGLAPEAYDGKKYIEIVDYDAPNADMIKHFHPHTFTNDANEQETVYYAIVERTQAEYDLLPDDIKANYALDEGTGTYKPKDSTNALDSVDNGIKWDFMFSNYAEYNMAGNIFIFHDTEKKTQNASMVCLHDKAGNVVYAYCMDAEKGTSPGTMYIIENLESADHIPGTAAEKAEALDHIRAATQKGYWGNQSGVGSLQYLKDGIRAALNDGMPVNFTFMGRVDGINDSVPFNYNSEEDLEELLAMIDNITEGEALNATQAAIWVYGNHKAESVTEMDLGVIRWYTLMNGEELVFNESPLWTGTQAEYDAYNRGVEARMELICAYLTSAYLKNKVKAENPGTTIIGDDTYLQEGSVQLTVGERVEGLDVNTDSDPDNDVYNVDLSFKLAVTPTIKDNMIVSLVNSANEVVAQAFIGEFASLNDSDEFSSQGGVYTFKGVELAENTDTTFSLVLQGVQYLRQAAYRYQSTEGSSKKQTLISIAQGSKIVNVSATFDLSFDVDEAFDMGLGTLPGNGDGNGDGTGGDGGGNGSGLSGDGTIGSGSGGDGASGSNANGSNGAGAGDGSAAGLAQTGDASAASIAIALFAALSALCLVAFSRKRMA